MPTAPRRRESQTNSSNMGGAPSKPSEGNTLPPDDEPTPVPPAHIETKSTSDVPESKEKPDPSSTPTATITPTATMGDASNKSIQDKSTSNVVDTRAPSAQIDIDPSVKATEPITNLEPAERVPVPTESGNTSESVRKPDDGTKCDDKSDVKPESKDTAVENSGEGLTPESGLTEPVDAVEKKNPVPSDAPTKERDEGMKTSSLTPAGVPQVNGTANASEMKENPETANNHDMNPATEVIPGSSHTMQSNSLPGESSTAGNGDDAPNQDDGMMVEIVDPDEDTSSPMKGIFIDESLPLLDLDELWDNIAAITDEDKIHKSVTVLTKELKQYFWSHHTAQNQKQLLKYRNDKDIFGMTVDQRIAMAKALEDKKVDLDDDQEEREDQAGNRILFALRCDDKTNMKKNVPDMTGEEDREFVKKIGTRLEGLQDHLHFKTIVEWFAFDMCIYIFAKGIYAAETGDKELHNTCRALEMLFAERAGPREMETQLKVTSNKCPKSDWDSFCFHGMCDISQMWTTVISRIPRKRSTFILKFAEHQEKMKEPLKNHRMAYHYDEWNEGGDPGGIRERFPDIMITFFKRILDISDKQWNENESIQKLAYSDGTPRKHKVIAQCKAAKEKQFRDRKNVNDLSKPNIDKDPELSPEEQIADDWLMEKHYLLNYALKVLQEIVYEIRVPGPNQSKEEHEFRRRTMKRVDELLQVLKRVGWNCTLRGIQVSRVHQYEEKVCPDNEVFIDGLGPVLKFTKGTEYTALSHLSIAFYMMCSLRVSDADEYDIMKFTLDGSGFEFLEPKRAFDEAMPYILSLLSLSAPSAPLSAVHICNLFVSRINGMFDVNETFNWRFGLIQSGRSVSVDGICMHMCRYVERVPNPELETRQFVYQSFQKILRKIENPAVRFGVVFELLHEVRRMELKAQLVTELKDVLAYGDSVMDSEFWNEELNDGMKMRFLECLMPRFLAPRKDSLAVIAPMLTLANALLFLAIRDKRSYGDKENAQKRLRFMRQYGIVAKEVARGICACVESDLKKTPRKKIENDKTMMRNYQVQKKAMTDGLRVISTIERTIDIIDEPTKEIKK